MASEDQIRNYAHQLREKAGSPKAETLIFRMRAKLRWMRKMKVRMRENNPTQARFLVRSAHQIDAVAIT
jgi:hypothetical protein